MNVIVLLKQTFDTEEKIALDQGRVKEDGVNFIINPYDEYAVEEAVKIKEQFGGEVTVVSVGPARSESAIRTALAMGADSAVLIEHEGEADEFVVSHMIASVIKDKPFDIILGGNMAVDSGAGQIAIRVAELLNIPHVASITKLTIDGNKAVAERDVEGDLEIIEVATPFLATAQQGLNEPRYPSLPGIMKAKKKPLTRLTIDDLGLQPEELAAKSAVTEQFLPPKKEAGKVLSGEISDQVKQLAQLLHTEAKVI